MHAVYVDHARGEFFVSGVFRNSSGYETFEHSHTLTLGLARRKTV